MSADNPHFKHVERSAFEFSRLLRSLSTNPDLTSADERLKFEAAECHAEHYHEAMLSGLESLGRVMFSACERGEWPVAQRDMSRLGAMITQIAVQVQFLDEFRHSVRDRFNEADKKGGRR